MVDSIPWFGLPKIGPAEGSAHEVDPRAQDGEHGRDATGAPPFYWVPRCQVAHRIEREQPNTPGVSEPAPKLWLA